MQKTYFRRLLFAAFALFVVQAAQGQHLVLTPYKQSGIYEIGEQAGWKVVLGGAANSTTRYSYSLKKNNFELLKKATLDLSSGDPKIEVRLNEPAMLYLEISPDDGSPSAKPLVAGAAVAPTELKPCAERPADFDSFWDSKIKLLSEVPANVVLTPKPSDKPNVDYATIRLDHINSKHVYGQIAKPSRSGKFPALVIFQWASPPYPLQKQWVTDRAAEGWLALNIEPHDVLPDEPPAYYQALPDTLKHYESIGNNDGDRCYFLQMYLADYRAVDYIASRPDWNGRTLVVNGISMGGQQSLCVAGLHPKITHVIVDVPAGCDTNGPLHGRQASYPNFPANDPQVMKTALYFDAVNFAPRIKATSLVAMGFVDTITAPAGIWTAFNQIAGPKEAVPMVDSPHNHLATAEQQRPYTDRSAEWLNTLVKGGDVHPRQLPLPQSTNKAASDDHDNMMDQLGIKSLRPGANPRNQEIFDEANANRYAGSLQDVLEMSDGTKVQKADQWPKRRAEIKAIFEREIYGRIPQNAPTVKWEVKTREESVVGGIPVITKTAAGHVDNRAYPEIAVDIQSQFTVPAKSSKPVPVIIVFSGRPRPSVNNSQVRGTASRARWTEEAIANGWGYALLVPGSVQPDNANGLRTGVIGLTNHGQPRKPDEWGALRAWQWGASRLLDYFAEHADTNVDASHVGIAGLSRFGKAALVTEAFDERFATGFIGSSGAGGAKLYRHIFGETVENLAGGEHYWMAGNFMKYAAAEASFGPKTTADLPVDAHELIALCAPRPCFISYGTVEGSDPKWVDARGSFMAALLASPVYELLGKKGLPATADFRTQPMPPVGQLIGHELAWRQHQGGHDLTPNWPAFFEWAGPFIHATPIAATTQARAVPRTDQNSKTAHQQLLEKARQDNIDVYFIGDSITRRWGCSDPQYADLLANWKENFFGWNAGNFGWGGDTTENILWRLQNGELDGVNPKVIVILAGTNDVAALPDDESRIAKVTSGIKTILDVCRSKAPSATIILTAIFPRNDRIDLMPCIEQINARLAELADGKQVRYLNVNSKLATKDGTLNAGMMVDKLHPTTKGYQVWADGLKPILTDLLGPPAKTDKAPAPTGDPSIHRIKSEPTRPLESNTGSSAGKQ